MRIIQRVLATTFFFVTISIALTACSKNDASQTADSSPSEVLSLEESEVEVSSAEAASAGDSSSSGGLSLDTVNLCVGFWGHLGYLRSLQNDNSQESGGAFYANLASLVAQYAKAQGIGEFSVFNLKQQYVDSLQPLGTEAKASEKMRSDNSLCNAMLENNGDLMSGVEWLQSQGKKGDAGLCTPDNDYCDHNATKPSYWN